MSRLPSETEDRLTRLVIGAGLTIDAARRALATGSDGAEPVTVSRNGADRIIRDARRRASDLQTVSDAAARVLSLVSRELQALEGATGPRDLDRLHKVAQILGTVERLRPKQNETKETGLMALAEEDTPAQNGATTGTDRD